MSTARRERAFTFIEVLAAVTVMVVGFLGLYLSFNASGALRESARETNTAMFKLQSTMEYLFSVPFDDITTVLPQGTPIDIVALTDSSPGNDFRLNGESITIEYIDPAADPIKFRIDIDWNTRFGTPRHASISSARMR